MNQQNTFFPNLPANNKALKGRLAAPRQYFGPRLRYVVAPVFTRFEALEWFVWDLEGEILPKKGWDVTPVIRQAAMFDEAVAGLIEGGIKYMVIGE
jgi:hypothetical protein